MTFMEGTNVTPETPAMEAQPVTPVESSTTTVTPESTTTTTVKKNNNKVLWIILGIIAFLILCCLITFGLLWASGAAFMQNLFGTAAKLSELDNTTTTTTTGGTQDTDTTDEDTNFGDLFSADGNFAVAVKDVERDGSNYVVTMDVKNQGTTPTTFSSLLYLELQDETGETYSQNFFYDIPQEERLDLELEAGQTFTGRIAFQVEGNPSSLTLLVRDSLFDENPTEFQIK
jgi:flagellar basal body-associated protein FliL